jgi:hypothetical protein
MLTKEELMKKDIRICILQRGWVIVGEFSREGMYCRINRGHVIRRWGTEGVGIGALTRGPRNETILDPLHGEVEFHELTQVQNIKCEALKWEKHLVD